MSREEESPEEIDIPTDVLGPFCAFARTVWIGLESPIEFADVDLALRTRALVAHHYTHALGTGLEHECVLAGHDGPARRWHAGRIAWLVENPSPEPVWVEIHGRDVGLEDGNHRLAAAVFRGDPDIACRVWGPDRLLRDLMEGRFETCAEPRF